MVVLEPRDYRKDASTERKALKAQRLELVEWVPDHMPIPCCVF